MEHRIVVAQHLHRPLKPWEIVHHIDGDKKNNNLTNLALVSPTDHQIITQMQQYIDKLEARVAELEGNRVA